MKLNMDKKLIKIFQRYEKKNKLHEFYEYIKQNNLSNSFLNELFYELFRPEKNKDYTSLIGCAMAISKEDFENVLGKDASNRLLTLIHKNPYPNVQAIYLNQLHNWCQMQEKDESQGTIVEKILDVFSQEGMTVGMHKIGTDKR